MNGTACRTLLAGLLWAAALTAAAEDEFGGRASWQAPAAADVEARLHGWLDQLQVDPTLRQRCLQTFRGTAAPAPGGETLDRLIEAASLVDEQISALRAQCQGRWRPAAPWDTAWLDEPARPAWLRADLKLFAGRWAAQQRLFDESLELIKDLDPSDVSDPAALLFYQAVGYHRLLDQEAGAQAVDRLLERESELPQRFQAVAKLLAADFRALEEESLDHISRRMDDIGRRLDLGRAGPKVRRIEDGVIESLDKLIKQEEDRQNQQNAAMAAGGGALPRRPSNPAQDSMPLGGKGPGEVTKKNIGRDSGGGNLDPKQREEALQQIGQDFPAHYRDVIEQYFRNLAAQDGLKQE